MLSYVKLCSYLNVQIMLSYVKVAYAAHRPGRGEPQKENTQDVIFSAVTF